MTHEGLALIGRDRVALALPGQKDAEQAVSQGETLTHEGAFEGVDSRVFVGGLLDQGDHRLELLLPLEQGFYPFEFTNAR